MGDHQVVPCRLRAKRLTGICLIRCVEQSQSLGLPCSGLASIGNDVIRQSAFATQGPLGGNAGLSVFSAQSVPGDQPLELLGFIAVDQPDFAAERLQTCFEQQRDHQHDGWRFGMEAECLIEALPHDRVDQLLKPLPLSGVLEDDATQGGSVDGPGSLDLNR